MVYASDFRKGITFEMNGEPHVVLDFQHVKPGKGAAFVRTKYRNIDVYKRQGLLREKHRSRDAGQPCRNGGQESGRPVFREGGR